MLRTTIVSALFVLAACADEDVADPCVFRVNVFEAQPPSVQVGLTVPIDLELTVRSGSCEVPQNASITWSTSNDNIAEIVSQTNTTAQVRAKKAGSAFITAWMTLAPSTRDSITITVTAPTDT